MLVIGLGFGWWVERDRIARQPIVGTAHAADLVDAVRLISRKQTWNLQIRSIESSGPSEIQIRTGPAPGSYSGELFYLKEVNGDWKVTNQSLSF